MINQHFQHASWHSCRRTAGTQATTSSSTGRRPGMTPEISCGDHAED